MTTPTKITRVLEVLDASSSSPANQCPPMERRITRNLAQFELLRASGLTWRQIALGLPSWCQKDGAPVSEDQIRGSFSRICRKRKRIAPPRPAVSSEVKAAPQRITRNTENDPLQPQATSTSSLMAQLELTRKLRQT